MKIKTLFVALLVTFIAVGCSEQKPNITMVEAVKAGNEKVVKYYIKHGEMVNQKDENGTP